MALDRPCSDISLWHSCRQPLSPTLFCQRFSPWTLSIEQRLSEACRACHITRCAPAEVMGRFFHVISVRDGETESVHKSLSLSLFAEVMVKWTVVLKDSNLRGVCIKDGEEGGFPRPCWNRVDAKRRMTGRCPRLSTTCAPHHLALFSLICINQCWRPRRPAATQTQQCTCLNAHYGKYHLCRLWDRLCVEPISQFCFLIY